MENVFADFLCQNGLYDRISITESNVDQLIDILKGNVRLDLYCNACCCNRVFCLKQVPYITYRRGNEFSARELYKAVESFQIQLKMLDIPVPGSQGKKVEHEWQWYDFPDGCDDSVIVLSFECAMDTKHRIVFVLIAEGRSLIKIGQFPSYADLVFPELDLYKKDIDEQCRKEMRRAIGLYAQGIGVGSFVYLRRIFEKILERTRQMAMSDKSIDLTDYDKKHMDERIKMLKSHLPELIVSSPEIYGIVSKGIHELSEEECIQYFPVMQECIFMILDQWAQKRKEQASLKALKTSLSTIAKSLK